MNSLLISMTWAVSRERYCEHEIGKELEKTEEQKIQLAMMEGEYRKDGSFWVFQRLVHYQGSQGIHSGVEIVPLNNGPDGFDMTFDYRVQE